MPPPPIPVLRVRGTHREVGRQIGSACADVIRNGLGAEAAGERSGELRLELAVEYHEATARSLPWLIEELDGCAEGAGVDALELFAASIEELPAAVARRSGDDAAAVPVDVARGRCSDLVAVPPATANGHVLVAHNNDLSPQTEDELVAIEWEVPGDPVVFSIGIGPWISVGFNSDGLALTGNELTPNDERIGMPRLLQVRAMLRARSLDAAVAEALRPDRASSYNNVLSHRDGRVVNVEGSATDAELTSPDARGALVHTNHYACDRMLRFEGDPEYAKRSAVRYRRAAQLLENAASTPGSVTEAGLRTMLADHQDAPDALCRHADEGSKTKTVFWVVADVTDGRVTFGRGNPCDSEAQSFRMPYVSRPA